MIHILGEAQAEWDYFLSQFKNDEYDYYLTRAYQSKSSIGCGILECFVYEHEGDVGLYPYLKTEILHNGNKYYDIESAYGYCGPVFNTKNEAFIRTFENNFLNYCQEQGIIAEFIRFNPFINNETKFKQKIQIEKNREIIVVDLSSAYEEIFSNQFSSKNRNSIRNAKKRGLTVNFEKDMKAFKSLYETTMNRLNAPSFYYFTDAYYEALLNDENVMQCNVVLGGQVIASALFFVFNHRIHYHLSGSNRTFMSYSTTNLLIAEFIKKYCNREYEVLNLGGGLMDSKEDPLYKFKKSFSKNTLDFYIGKRIHNESIYNRLIEIWENKNKVKSKLFLQYRL